MKLKNLFILSICISCVTPFTMCNINANTLNNDGEKIISTRDATAYHPVVTSHTYKEVGPRSKTYKTVYRSVSDPFEQLVLCNIPFLGVVCRTDYGKFHQYETKYKYTTNVSYYDSMGHFIYRTVYSGTITGYYYVRVND